ncbi:hypothetical protein JCM9140_3828 [Halalkalibacter wakoensis JCM 9140]|uniref:Uncharacterized protein n=1 Tax=Halalkalibacter wakoensis JCM 9140 TaxID=1236970 RepID=W4Q6P6_9BACI|nr:hypothetical protein JCM9140_3828 [Halalkalibacter wakoensis JCM 9140]
MKGFMKGVTSTIFFFYCTRLYVEYQIAHALTIDMLENLTGGFLSENPVHLF